MFHLWRAGALSLRLRDAVRTRRCAASNLRTRRVSGIMEARASDFALAVEGVSGTCPAGERYATEQMALGRIPVLSCEGPCIRGEIARLAANMTATEAPALAGARGLNITSPAYTARPGAGNVETRAKRLILDASQQVDAGSFLITLMCRFFSCAKLMPRC